MDWPGGLGGGRVGGGGGLLFLVLVLLFLCTWLSTSSAAKEDGTHLNSPKVQFVWAVYLIFSCLTIG
jgi:hypothetical protein